MIPGFARNAEGIKSGIILSHTELKFKEILRGKGSSGDTVG